MGDKIVSLTVSEDCKPAETEPCRHVITFVYENKEVRKTWMGPHEILHYYDTQLSPEQKRHLQHSSLLVPCPSYLEDEFPCVRR